MKKLYTAILLIYCCIMGGVTAHYFAMTLFRFDYTTPHRDRQKGLGNFLIDNDP